MQICLPHYDKLKTAIKVRGMWDMVGGSKQAMADKFTAAIDGPKEVEHFDPLLAANNMIWSVGMKCFGLGLMQPDEHGNHRCPVCEAEKRGAMDWIEKAASEAERLAQNFRPAT